MVTPLLGGAQEFSLSLNNKMHTCSGETDLLASVPLAPQASTRIPQPPAGTPNHTKARGPLYPSRNCWTFRAARTLAAKIQVPGLPPYGHLKEKHHDGPDPSALCLADYHFHRERAGREMEQMSCRLMWQN